MDIVIMWNFYMKNKCYILCILNADLLTVNLNIYYWSSGFSIEMRLFNTGVGQF